MPSFASVRFGLVKIGGVGGLVYDFGGVGEGIVAGDAALLEEREMDFAAWMAADHDRRVLLTLTARCPNLRAPS